MRVFYFGSKEKNNVIINPLACALQESEISPYWNF